MKTKALHDLKLSPGAKLVYAMLDEIAWDGECKVSQPELADRLQMNLRSIERYVRELREHGYIEINVCRPYPSVVAMVWKTSAKVRLNPDSSVGIVPTPVAVLPVAGLQHASRARCLTDTKDKQTDQRAAGPVWSDVEVWLAECLEEFPGAARLPGRPDLIVVRACLDLGPPQVLREALRQLGLAHQAPARSWMWFPTAIASKLGIRRQA